MGRSLQINRAAWPRSLSPVYWLLSEPNRTERAPTHGAFDVRVSRVERTSWFITIRDPRCHAGTIYGSSLVEVFDAVRPPQRWPRPLNSGSGRAVPGGRTSGG